MKVISRNRIPGLALVLAWSVTAGAVFAGDMVGGWGKAPAPGKESIAELAPPEPWVKLTAEIRLRYEYGDQQGKDTSNAVTVRGRFGLLTREFAGFQFFGEYEGTLPFDRDSYRAASSHGPPNKTVIADPASNELNQLWGSFSGIEGAKVKAGRQRIILDNSRYVGNVGWRQNEQTFDAAGITLSPFEEFEFYYAYMNRANRIFGSQVKAPAQKDFTGDSHFIHAAYSGFSFGKLVAYAYLLDLHNAAGDTNSNNSFGANLSGDLPVEGMSYYAEYGYQTDAYDSPLSYGAHYAHANIGAKLCEAAKTTLGYEYLGSDNGVGYKFPLATLHKFNGFADVFLATPPDGLQDAYVNLALTKLPFDAGLSAIYHHFWNDSGSRLGNEIDLVLTKELPFGLAFLAKYAYFNSKDDRYAKIHRFIAQVEYRF